MNFEFDEDRLYFEKVMGVPIKKIETLFDFRDARIKRKEFNRVRNILFQELKKRYGITCMLALTCCNSDSGFVIDHIIPLSTNQLNKELRNIKANTGKKVIAQSFGSNHFDNLVIACNTCNNSKKHKILDAVRLVAILNCKEKYI